MFPDTTCHITLIRIASLHNCLFSNNTQFSNSINTTNLQLYVYTLLYFSSFKQRIESIFRHYVDDLFTNNCVLAELD